MDDQRERDCHHIDDNLSDQHANDLHTRFNARAGTVPRTRMIRASAPERDGTAGCNVAGGAAASVALGPTALAAVTDRELSHAASTSQKSSQQGFVPANRTAAHVALPIGVVADQALILFKLCPGNIALMVVLHHNLPIIPAAM